jgi:lipoprotein-anchoring transpeptidase ErfK/SrfK
MPVKGFVARGLVTGVLLIVAVLATPQAYAAPAVHRSAPALHPPASPIDTRVLEAQVLLARAGFSPGTIDGRDGDNFTKTLHAFQQANGLPVGRLDDATSQRLAHVSNQLSNQPALADYAIQPQDVAGPFSPVIPADYTQMARLPQLSYRSPRQRLAERFRMSEGLLAALNPSADFARSGTTIRVANVAPMPDDEPKAAAAAAREAPKAARVVVAKRDHAVTVFDADNRLMGFFPASIGSAEKPAPSGTQQVRSVDYDPDYTYDPAYRFRGQSAERKVTVRPGPNNPVGLVWIGLSEKGYGIHGAPDPDTVGKAQSHGCIRLTNWDALTLARMVDKGTRVDFVD